MKILLVFLSPAQTEQQKRKVQTFITIIEEAFKQRPLAPRPEIILRDRNTVEDHLIDMGSSDANPHNRKVTVAFYLLFKFYSDLT